MKKTLHYCDICGKEKNSAEIKGFNDVDICLLCQRLIITKIIASKTLNLRPWCKVCHGKGQIEESEAEPHGRVIRSYHECKECKI